MNTRRARCLAGWLLGLLLALASQAPAQAADAVTLLERALRTPRSVAHTGTLKVTLADGDATSVRVVWDGKGRERREYLDGAARGTVVLTDQNGAWQKEANARLWTKLPPTAHNSGSWERLRRNYQCRALGNRQMAGRTACGIALVPRHAGNPKQTLWLDAATGLILRAESYDSSGAPFMTSAYTSVTFGAPRGTALAPPAADAVAPPLPMDDWQTCRSVTEMEQRLGYPVPLPKRLPPGYALAGVYLRGCRQGGALPVLRYDNGLNGLTLFVTGGRGPGAGRGRGRGFGRGLGLGRGGGGWGGRGACRIERLAGQNVASMTQGAFSYVLVGDLPAAALERTLASLE